jgi:DNA-binding winged helix-turn-helix (wHTH) protein/tetratricopeptide (TPR) repeat protein
MQNGSAVYRFGAFEFHAHTRELRKHGMRVSLEDQPARVLATLVTRAGEMISRDELKDALWTDDTYVEFDRSLTRAVSKLRTALGDTAVNPKFIETLPRRGYRFVAPVFTVGGTESPVTSPPAPAAPLRRWARVTAITLLVAVVGAGTGAFLYRRASKAQEAEQAYQRGIRLSRQRRLREAQAAAQEFRHAIQLRPGFARAYAGMAEVASLINPAEAKANVEMAERAVRLDPKCGECRGTLGFLLFTKQWRWREAEDQLRLAIEYSPDDGQMIYWHAQLTALLGRPDVALKLLEAAMARLPQELKLHVLKAGCLYFLRDYKAAVRAADEAIGFDLAPAVDWRSRALFMLGDRYEAVRSLYVGLGAWVWRREDVSERANQAAASVTTEGLAGPLGRMLDMTAAPRIVEVHASNRAQWQMLLGRREAALGELETALSGKSYDMIYVAVDPVFEPLHNEPRFQKVLERMKLTAYRPLK